MFNNNVIDNVIYLPLWNLTLDCSSVLLNCNIKRILEQYLYHNLRYHQLVFTALLSGAIQHESFKVHSLCHFIYQITTLPPFSSTGKSNCKVLHLLLELQTQWIRWLQCCGARGPHCVHVSWWCFTTLESFCCINGLGNGFDADDHLYTKDGSILMGSIDDIYSVLKLPW